MNNLIWKMKQTLNKAVPYLVILTVLYGGYYVYRKGSLTRGIGAAVSSVVRHIPFFGSRFRHYGGGTAYRHGYYRHAHGRRGHHRGRRHHRHHR